MVMKHWYKEEEAEKDEKEKEELNCHICGVVITIGMSGLWMQDVLCNLVDMPDFFGWIKLDE